MRSTTLIFLFLEADIRRALTLVLLREPDRDDFDTCLKPVEEMNTFDLGLI